MRKIVVDFVSPFPNSKIENPNRKNDEPDS